MRGKGDICIAANSGVGITPAYAGKSAHTRRCPSIDWDHPRLCGEKFSIFSPPNYNVRITPAYAGKSSKKEL